MYRHSLFFSLLLLAGCWSTILGQIPNQPEQDCIGAIPVCSDILQVPFSYVAAGLNPNEVNPNTSCLATGELNSVWFRFQPEDTGTICFTIKPYNPIDDYDWAVYNLTNDSCSSIATDSSLEVACNFFPNQGCAGWTGASGQTAGPCGAQNAPCIPVLKDEAYVIVVSNFSASANGFALDFSASTTLVYDSIRAEIDSVTNSPSVNGLWVTLTRPILCSQIAASSFTVQDTNGMLPILSATPLSCSGSFTDSVEILLATPLTPAQLVSLTVSLTPQMVHLCDYDSLTAFLVPRPVGSLTVAISAQGLPDAFCQLDSVLLQTPFSKQPDFQTTWMPGNIVADSIWVLADDTTTYQATVKYLPKQISGTGSLSLDVALAPTLDVPDISSCNDSVSASVNGFAHYLWSTGDTIPDPIFGFAQEGLQWLEVTTAEGCTVRDSFTLSFEMLPMISLTATPDTSAATFRFLANSQGADSIFWELGDGTRLSGEAITHVYTQDSIYQVILTAINSCGQVSDTLQIEVITSSLATPYATHFQIDQTRKTLSLQSTIPIQAHLLTLQGQTVWQAREAVLEGIWDLSFLPKGIYVLRLSRQDGSIAEVQKVALSF